MADPSYQPKVYMRQGGDVQVVAAGGEILHEEGSKVTLPTVIKTAAHTVLASESGTTFITGAVDLKFTLPPTAAGLRYTFLVKTLSTSTGCQLSPDSDDKIMGNGFTAANDKDAINTAGTDAEGDMMTLVGDGVDGWLIEAVLGTWAREG